MSNIYSGVDISIDTIFDPLGPAYLPPNGEPICDRHNSTLEFRPNNGVDKAKLGIERCWEVVSGLSIGPNPTALHSTNPQNLGSEKLPI